MFAAIYKWRVLAGREAEFEEAWRLGTIAIRDQLGGQGARLHRAANGEYFAYAQWPDEETWRRAADQRMPYKDDEARRLYSSAIDGPVEHLYAFPVVIDLLDAPKE
jgi:heme-degrading monooxygenase HmoA